jgi:NAD(P)-dependent dehydrogenase (short-subunit alcohol dehydrogenase family)
VNLLIAREFARRLRPYNVVSNAVHPGAVQTDLFKNIPFFGVVIHFLMGILYKSAKVTRESLFSLQYKHDNFTQKPFLW